MLRTGKRIELAGYPTGILSNPTGTRLNGTASSGRRVITYVGTLSYSEKKAPRWVPILN